MHQILELLRSTWEESLFNAPVFFAPSLPYRALQSLPGIWEDETTFTVSLITGWTVYSEKYKARGPDV